MSWIVYPKDLGMEVDHSRHFTEATETSFELIHEVVDCNKFLLYKDIVFCLSRRNTLVVPSEDEEYEFYGSIVTMAIYGHHIYLIFESSKILVFDVLSREVVSSFPGHIWMIKKVKVCGMWMYFLCDDGCLYKSSFENLRYIKQDVGMRGSGDDPRISDFGVSSDTMFFSTDGGTVYRDSRVVLKTFDRIDLLVPCGRYLYVLTGKGLLIKYDSVSLRTVFVFRMGRASVVGETHVICNGVVVDLFRETYTRVPKDTRGVVRRNEDLYIQTLSGIWGS